MSTPNRQPDLDLAKVMMTLAGIVYAQPSAIPGYLADSSLLDSKWELAWLADDVPDPATFAMLVKDRRDGRYALAIRGTYTDPFSKAYWDDSNLDNPFGRMKPWPGAASDAKVSRGTWLAFEHLLSLRAEHQSLKDALLAVPATAAIYVTGHSLGGTLAPVVALWLFENSPSVTTTVFAFAGMTPGNRAFARLFAQSNALDHRVWRYNNTLDAVGYGWDRVWATHNLFKPKPQSDVLIKALIAVMAFRLLFYGFRSIGTEIPLKGRLIPTAVDHGLIAYILENLSQHFPNVYLALLGAPLLPFSLEYGAVVVPGNLSEGDLFDRVLRRQVFYLKE